MDFVERERTPEWIAAQGIQSHITGLSLTNAVESLEDLGVQRSRTAVHDRVQSFACWHTAPNHPSDRQRRQRRGVGCGLEHHSVAVLADDRVGECGVGGRNQSPCLAH